MDKNTTKHQERSRATKSLRIMVILELIYLPMSFLLPCGWVLHYSDPRPFMWLMIFGVWIYHLICVRSDKSYKLLDSILAGILILAVDFAMLF